MARGSRSTFTVETEVDISEALEEASDEDIIEEARNRGMIIAMPAAAPAEEVRGKVIDPKDLAEDAMSHLLGKRHGRALDAMRQLIATYIPPGVLDAYEAMLSSEPSRAICALDRFAAPSPAATATSLPRKEIAA